MQRKNHPNYRRWLKPPTIEQIDEAVAMSGVNGAQFERYYNIPPGTIKKIRCNERTMPVFYWHLFLSEGTIRKVPKPVTALQPVGATSTRKTGMGRIKELL